jgi:hypothetical protein
MERNLPVRLKVVAVAALAGLVATVGDVVVSLILGFFYAVMID